MNKLKTELLMLCREKGDVGDNDDHRQLIEIFFASLQAYLTPAGIETFTADQLRTAYVEFAKLCVQQKPMPEILESLALLFHIRNYPRDKPHKVGVSSDSVVDIFSRRS